MSRARLPHTATSLSQSQKTDVAYVLFMTAMGAKRVYLQDKGQGKEGQTECLEGNYAQSIFMQCSITPSTLSQYVCLCCKCP